jgi:hypothetical protein
MEVIWHRSLTGLLERSIRATRAAYFFRAEIVSLDPAQTSRARSFGFGVGGGDLGWNCVETRMAAAHHVYHSARQLIGFRIIFWV